MLHGQVASHCAKWCRCKQPQYYLRLISVHLWKVWCLMLQCDQKYADTWPLQFFPQTVATQFVQKPLQVWQCELQEDTVRQGWSRRSSKPRPQSLKNVFRRWIGTQIASQTSSPNISSWTQFPIAMLQNRTSSQKSGCYDNRKWQLHLEWDVWQTCAWTSVVGWCPQISRPILFW